MCAKPSSPWRKACAPRGFWRITRPLHGVSYSFFIQPAPGHTLGQIALVAQIDGVRVGFSGDLIAAPGKVQTLYDLQYAYGSADGCDYMVYSLAKMREQSCDLLCPSHGDPLRDTGPALQALEEKFRAYMQHRWSIDTPTHDIGPRAILPHLLQIPGCSNTWIVVSDSGKALFVDYGSQSLTFMYSFSVFFEAGNRLRMQEHNLDLLRANFGVRQIDLALPSHYHDDHVNGLPYLQRHHGTRVWCFENMVDIMRHPHGYKLGCTYPEPVAIERGLGQGERFKWEEYEFQVFHSPGHADYHMAMFGEIDGRRVAFSGDEVSLRGEGECFQQYLAQPRAREFPRHNRQALPGAPARAHLSRPRRSPRAGPGGLARLSRLVFQGAGALARSGRARSARAGRLSRLHLPLSLPAAGGTRRAGADADLVRKHLREGIDP